MSRMDIKPSPRARSRYPTAQQKRKLIGLMSKHPELVSFRVTQDFNFEDSQRLWRNIAMQCNAIPGARKTWRQWRKTWQDMKSKTKKQQESKGETPISVILSAAKQEALGFKKVSSTTNQESPEFIPLDVEHIQENVDNGNSLNIENVQDSLDCVSNASLSEPETPPERKLFVRSNLTGKKTKNIQDNNSTHSNNCSFNCDMLVLHEQRKLQIKEDYYTFRKDYLQQKLLIMKEQTKALMSIAKDLANAK